MQTLNLLFLAFQSFGLGAAPHVHGAAVDAGKEWVRRVSEQGVPMPEQVRLDLEGVMADSDWRAVEDALRVTLAGQGIQVGGERSNGPHLYASVDRNRGGDRLVLRSNTMAEAIEVPFLRKDWVRGDGRIGSAATGGVVVGDYCSTEEEARKVAVARLRRAVEARAIDQMRARAGVLANTDRFRRESRRALDARLVESTVRRTIADEYVEQRMFSVGPMTRVHLRLDEDAAALRSIDVRAASEGRALARRHLLRGGAIVGGWALLMAVCALLDRATRGWLTWRIRLACGGLGAGLFYALWIL